MRAEDRVRIRHMTGACEAAINFVAGREREELDTDLMLRFANVRPQQPFTTHIILALDSRPPDAVYFEQVSFGLAA